MSAPCPTPRPDTPVQRDVRRYKLVQPPFVLEGGLVVGRLGMGRLEVRTQTELYRVRRPLQTPPEAGKN